MASLEHISRKVRKGRRKGFTLLELMVACLLLGILMTALTMVFNQSAVAWRTGMAGVVNLYYTRTDLGRMHDNYDNILPGLKKDEDMEYRAVSLWKDGQLRTDRAFAWEPKTLDYDDAAYATPQGISEAGRGQSVSLFTIGVRSAGPDGRFGTADDLTTYPEDL